MDLKLKLLLVVLGFMVVRWLVGDAIERQEHPLVQASWFVIYFSCVSTGIALLIWAVLRLLLGREGLAKFHRKLLGR